MEQTESPHVDKLPQHTYTGEYIQPSMCWLAEFIHWDIFLGFVLRLLNCIDCKAWAWAFYLLRAMLSMEIHYLLAWYVFYDQLGHSIFYMLGFTIFHFIAATIVFIFGIYAIWEPGDVNETRRFFLVYKILNVVMDILLVVAMVIGIFKSKWFLPSFNIRHLVILILVCVDLALDIMEIMAVGIHCCCH